MAATNRFQLLVESQSKGEAEIARLNSVVNKLASDIEKANAKISASSTSASRSQSEAIKRAAKDTQAGSAAMSTSLSSFAGGALAAYASVQTLATGFQSIVRASGEAALEIKSLSLSTGLTISQSDKLRASAILTGFDIRNLKEAALDLSVALKDTGGQGDQTRQLLKQLGVSAFDATGRTRPLNAVLLETFDALSKVEDVTARVNLSRVLGGEDAAKNVQPLLAGYREANQLAEQLGFGTRDGLLKALDESNKQLRAFDLQWEVIKSKLAQQIAPIVIPFLVKVSAAAGGDLNALGSLIPGTGTVRDLGTAFGQQERERFGFGSGADTITGAGVISGRLPTAPLGLTDFSTGSQLAARFRGGAGGPEAMKIRLDQIAKDRAGMVSQLSSGALNESTFNTVQSGLARLDAEQRAINKQLAFIERARALGEIQIDSSSLVDVNIGASISTRRVPSLRGRATSLPDLPEFVARESDIAVANPYNDLGMSARAAAEFQKEQQSRQRNIQFLGQELAFQERKIDLLTGPGGEIAAINRIAELRLAALESELQLGGDLFDLNERRMQVEEDRSIRLLELQVRRRSEAAGLASDFVDSIQAGDPTSFFRQQGGKLINQVGTNALTGTFQRVQSTLGRFGASTGLGSLLGGTILDPANATPLDKTAAATERTANATERIAASVSGGIPGTGGSLRGFDPIRALGPASGFTGGFSSTLGQITGGAASVLAPGGLFAGLRPEGSIQLGNGRATTALGLGLGGTAARTANVAGSIAALGAGTLTAIRGFQQGGLSGITQGITASLGTAALVPGPQQPFIAAAAATAALVSMLLPDPKKARDRAINRQLEEAYYAEASPLAYNFDQMGYGYDTNKRGDMRQDVTIVVQTLDAKSFSDNRDLITDAVRQSVYEGHALNRAMRETLLAA